MESNRWFCLFRSAYAKGDNRAQRTALTWSDDAGATWSEPTTPWEPPTIEGRAGQFRVGGMAEMEPGQLLAVLCWVDHANPDAPFFNEETEGLLDTRIFTSVSRDRGSTWSEPLEVDPSPFEPPLPITGPPLRLANGDLACQFEQNKPYTDPEPWRHASLMLFSSDGGKTWPRHSVVTEDPTNRIFYWDQRPTVLPDGRMFDVFWSFDHERGEYLNIHACVSDNRARSWSPLWDTGLPGQPGPVFVLTDGALAMPVVDRTEAPVIRIHRSTDGGQTWCDGRACVVHQAEQYTHAGSTETLKDAWATMVRYAVGLPYTAALPGGGALLTYYAGEETDLTAIRWAEVR
jgi:hypothetical protein